MRSTFLGFNTVRSGLFASQRALDVTGHNISNINTSGYTRQRLNQTQSHGLNISGGKGVLGTGVDMTSITQLRNEFLDYKFRGEVSTLGYWETKSQGLKLLESIFNEMDEDSGMTKVIDDFFNAFHELSKNPDEKGMSVRVSVRERAHAFTNSLNHTYEQLEKSMKDLNFDIEATVTSINTYARQIADLNKQIFRIESDGSHANDLRDQRNLLIDELSQIADVNVVEVGDPTNPKIKKVMIQLNGYPLVDHDAASLLDTTGKKSVNIDGQLFELMDIKWESGASFDTTKVGGELGALLALRDGDSKENKGIPYYIKQLNDFARTFAMEVNKLHLYGRGLDGKQGVAFFTADGVGTPSSIPDDGLKDPLEDSTYYDSIFSDGPGGLAGLNNITAKNIKVSLDVDRDEGKIAAGTMPPEVTPEGDTIVSGDGSNAIRLSELRQKVMFNGTELKGTPEDYLKSLVANLGVNAQEANRMADNMQILVYEIDRQRAEVSAVSMNEELSNMMKFQHAYNASARMITTMDEMIDVIISRMGVVGR